MTLRASLGLGRIRGGFSHIARDRHLETVAISDIIDAQMISYLLRLPSTDEPASAAATATATQSARSPAGPHRMRRAVRMGRA